jgi:hypothetical protein
MSVAKNCLSCETAKSMDRFEDETFTIEHAGPCASLCLNAV